MRTSNLSVSKISFLLSLGITVGAWLFMHLARDWLVTPYEISPEFISLYELEDATSQRVGHYLAVLFIALAALGLLIGTTFKKTQFPQKLSTPLAALQKIVERPSHYLVFVLILMVFSWNWPWNVILVPGALVVMGFVACVLNFIGRRTSDFIWICLILAPAIVLLILPLLSPFDLSKLTVEKYLYLIETHFSSVLGSAEKLEQGGVLFENVGIQYGVFSNVIISIFIDLDLSDYLRLQQYSNIIFFLCCFLAYGQAAKWQFHVIFVLGLFIIPLLSNWPVWIYFPNQTGMRYLGFSLALMFLAYSDKLNPNMRSILSGALSAICILLNTETGIVILVAMIAYVFFSNNIRLWHDSLLKYAVFMISFVGVIVTFFLLASLILVHTPQLDSMNLIVTYLLRIILSLSGGFSGVKISFFALGFLFLVYAGYFVILLIIKWEFRKLDNLQAIRLAISLMIVGWLAYYFNRPSLRNLWTIFVLFGYLIIPLLDRRFFKLFVKSLPRPSIPVPTLMILLILAPHVMRHNLISNFQANEYLNNLESAGTHSTAIYSGVRLKKELVGTLDRKVSYLKNIPPDKTFVYMSAFAFTMPLQSGRSSFDFSRNPFTEIITIKGHESLIDKLKENGPNLLIFDDYGSFKQQDLSLWKSFYNKIRRRIEAFYELKESTHGWHVYVRK